MDISSLTPLPAHFLATVCIDEGCIKSGNTLTAKPARLND